ncbi:uncharacterized protein [Periplaneta americana]|uniref:uncharacterized protein n=1 Tax=Periplaneta americana TaxID=6978 RepID=UPI0037E9893C
MKKIIVLSILVTVVVSTENDLPVGLNDEAEKKDTIGTWHHYDLAVLGTILAIKFKAVLLVLAVIFGIGVYFKLFAGFGGYYKGLKCPPPVVYESPHKYHHEAYGHPDRRDRAIGTTKYSEKLDFELLSTVMKGIGLEDLSFNVTDKENVSCKKRFICEADKMAPELPVLSHAFHVLSGLNKYRTSGLRNRRSYNCTALYPECINSAHLYSERVHHINKLVEQSGSNGRNRQHRRE